MSDGGTPMGSTPAFPSGGAAMGTGTDIPKSEQQKAFEQMVAAGGAAGGGLAGYPPPCTHPRWSEPEEKMLDDATVLLQRCMVCNKSERVA
jgi:hypothetical protein